MLVVLGCMQPGPLMASGGFHVSQEWFRQDMDAIRPKAAFAFNCPGEQIEGVVLAVNPEQLAAPSQIGASGCGHRAIFVAHSSGWTIASDTTSSAAITAAPRVSGVARQTLTVRPVSLEQLETVEFPCPDVDKNDPDYIPCDGGAR